MRVLAAIAVIGGLAGCNGAVGPQADMLARGAAKTVVNSVVESRFPGVNAAPVTDCIIDNATSPEIVVLAQSAVTGVTPATTDLVVDIATRPDTVTCASRNAFDLLGLGNA